MYLLHRTASLFFPGLVLAVVAHIAIAPLVAAEPPYDVSYQGLLLDTSGDALAGPVDITIGVFDTLASGTELYRETHVGVALADGVFSILLGTGSKRVGSFDANLFAAQNRYLEVTVSGETLTPRQPFSSVAYALQAGGAGRVGAIQASDIVTQQNFQTSFTAKVPQVSDSQVPSTVARDSEFTAGDQALDTKITKVKNDATALSNRVSALEILLAGVSRDEGNKRLIFTGLNVQIVNGLNATSSKNSFGNLILGYNENAQTFDRSGSHNLVVGFGHGYSSYGGAVLGLRNQITSTAPFSSVTGGQDNKVGGFSSNVSGGQSNTADGPSAHVSGGQGNLASGFWSSVSGGLDNVASKNQSSVSGGSSNTASSTNASVSGGSSNTASSTNASVSGGQMNTANAFAAHVSGGQSNMASGGSSSVSGGQSNKASNDWTSVSGGQGKTADADHATWTGPLHVSTVTIESDRNLKEAFASVDPSEVLDRVAALPIREWRYTAEPEARHVGPMAQDFREAFGLGLDEKGIATVDADGVALAAIQGLHALLMAQQVEIRELHAKLDALSGEDR